MTILIRDLHTSQNLDRKTMGTIVGGLFAWAQQWYFEADDGKASCYDGSCGVYPLGARTDETR